MQRLVFLFSFVLLFSCGDSKQDTSSTSDVEEKENSGLTFSNPSDNRIASFGVEFEVPESGPEFRLRDGNVFLPYQLDDLDQDGTNETVFTLLDFAGQESKTLEIQSGKSNYPSKTQVAIIDETPVWENDLVAYFLDYNDGGACKVLAKTGNDIFFANNNNVLANLKGVSPLTTNNVGLGTLGVLLSKSNYPEIKRDSFAPLQQFSSKQFEVVASGPLRTIFNVIYSGVKVGNEELDLKVSYEMHAGHHWTDVNFEVLKSTKPNLTFGVGIPKQKAAFNLVTGTIGDYFWGYSFGEQSLENDKMGFSLMIPLEYQPRNIREGFGDAHVMLLQTKDNKAKYRFLSTWEQGPNNVNAAPLLLRYIRKLAEL